MLKNLNALEVKIGERFYRFMCEGDSLLGEVHDVICQMKHFVIEKIQEAEKAEQVVQPEVKKE